MKLRNIFYYVNCFDMVFTILFFRAEVNPIIVKTGLITFIIVKLGAMAFWFVAWKIKDMGELKELNFDYG